MRVYYFQNYGLRYAEQCRLRNNYTNIYSVPILLSPLERSAAKRPATIATFTTPSPKSPAPNQSSFHSSLTVLKPSAFKATVPPGALKASNTPAPPPTTSSTRRPNYNTLRPFSVPPVSTLYTASLADIVPTAAYSAANTTPRREQYVTKQATRRRKPAGGIGPAAAVDTKTKTKANKALLHSGWNDDHDEIDEDYYEAATRRGDANTQTRTTVALVTPSTVPKTTSTKVPNNSPNFLLQ